VNRLEAWLLHAGTILLTLTGLLYGWMHYLMKPADPFAVVNHPLEPYLLDAHVLLAPLLVFAVGLILHSHVLTKLQLGSRVARKSGIVLVALFIVMVVSGYALQATTGSLRTASFVVHLSSGSLWAILYVAHQISSLRYRRVLTQNGRSASSNGRITAHT
jgi:hypothetical protein